MPVWKGGSGARRAGACAGLAALALATGRASAAPPSVALTPQQVVQGQAVQLDLHAPGADAAVATAGGRSLVLFQTPWGYRGFFGTSPATPPGQVVVRVRVRSVEGWRELLASASVKVRSFGVRRLSVPPALLDPALVAHERRRVQLATAAPWVQPLWDGPFHLPVRGPVSSPYGVRSVYNRRWWGHHLGVDFRVPAGQPVRAAQNGLVVLAERLPLGGNTVILDHGAGVFTAYLHLASVTVQVGQHVRAGQVVGTVGSTGLSTAPHLHWELRVNGVLVDPLVWTENFRGGP